jgi:hypothetical protein
MHGHGLRWVFFDCGGGEPGPGGEVSGVNGGAPRGQGGGVATCVVERNSVGDGVVGERGMEHCVHGAGDGRGLGMKM